MSCRHEKTRSLAVALIAIAALTPGLAHALPIPPTFNWRASAPGTDPAEWSATVGTHQWDVAGAGLSSPGSAYPGITQSFDVDAGDAITSTSFQTIAGGNPSNEDLSLELWFRPDSMTGNEQVLFETGGNRDGLSLLLDDNILTFRVKDNGTVVTRTHDLGSDPSEFFQAAITISLDGTASFYVDGLLSGTASAAGLDDWTNNDGAGIGSINGQLGGNDGGDLDAYGDFAGDIALLRFYRNQVLTPAEVQQNFDSIATPEPGTALLVGLGLVALARRRATLRARRR